MPHLEASKLVVIADFSHDPPIGFICETLCVLVEHQTAFSVWSTDLNAVRNLLVERRKHPAADILLDLIRTVDELDEPFTDEDLIVLVINFIFGGHDSSRSMIASAIVLLVQHPGELARLHAGPAMTASVGDEILCYELIMCWRRSRRRTLSSRASRSPWSSLPALNPGGESRS